MSDDGVVRLRVGEPRLWVCQCGCSTFELLDTGDARCASCCEVSDGRGEGWYSVIADKGDRSAELGSPTRDVQGNGSVEFARRRLQHLSSGEDVCGIVVMRDDGAVHAWGMIETADHLSWFEKNLEIAGDLVRSYFRG